MNQPVCTDIEKAFAEAEAAIPPISFEQSEISRRSFLQAATAVSAATAVGLPALAAETATPQSRSVTLRVNGQSKTLKIDSRTVLLDALREDLDLTGTKKGCDHGQCGACTVLLNGRRVNSCLTLAYAAEGSEVVTVEGLASGEGIEGLHPVQAAFVTNDAFQCGYCTPGQICSAVGLLEEAKRGTLSIVSLHTGQTTNPTLSDDEIRERMSGNICRCGAYPNIVAAVRSVSQMRAS